MSLPARQRMFADANTRSPNRILWTELTIPLNIILIAKYSNFVVLVGPFADGYTKSSYGRSTRALVDFTSV